MAYDGVSGNEELESAMQDPELKKEIEKMAKELRAKKAEKLKKLGKRVVAFKKTAKSLQGEVEFLNSLDSGVKADLAVDLRAILEKLTDAKMAAE